MRRLFLMLAGLIAACSSGTALQARETPDAPPPRPTTLDVLTYNVFMRPPPVNWGDETACRAQRIGAWLGRSDLDVVVLTETFHADDVRALSDRAAASLPHQSLSQPRGAGAFSVSGGLSVLSRWPIESTRTLSYATCSGPVSDCVATKGALHAVLRLDDDLVLNVVATHLDAGRGARDRAARSKQLRELRGFVDQIDHQSGPVVIVGDFNVDALLGDEYDELKETLDVAHYDVTSPSTLNCKTTIRCEEPVPAERLDYIFRRRDEHRLTRRTTEHLSMEDPACGSRYLSDHRAVRSTFELGSTGP